MRDKRLSILIIGSGGREHALVWKISQSKITGQIYCAPGNAGTGLLAENIPIEATDLKKLLAFAKEKKIDLTVVGPEAPLEMGIVDLFTNHNLTIFGPTQKAARLETSKAWAVKFMKKYQIPHPKSESFQNASKATAYIKLSSYSQLVIKAGGLAAGKGVIVPESLDEAIEAVKRIMTTKEFGDAGKEILIQERVFGKEVSVLAFCDEKTFGLLPTAQDHKRVFDGDRGPNTGGMGAYAPVPFLNKKLLTTIQTGILKPLLKGMKKEGHPYKGILYAGLMLTKDGPKVLEFNCRFGDPETQPQIVLLDGDLVKIMLGCVNGHLNKNQVKFKKGTSCCVVLASKGYPGHYEKGEIIHGLAKITDQDVQIFHSGTAFKNGQVVTNGGRVLGVTGYGKNIDKAIKKTYSVIGKQGVHFKQMHYRKDIGEKVII